MISTLTDLNWKNWMELAMGGGGWNHVEMMMGGRGRMAGASDGTAINPNGEISIVGEMVINEGKQNNSGAQIRIEEINPKIEVTTQAEAPRKSPSTCIPTPKPPLPAPPVMVKRTEVHGNKAIRDPVQTSAEAEPSSGIADKRGGGKLGKGPERKREMEAIISFHG